MNRHVIGILIIGLNYYNPINVYVTAVFNVLVVFVLIARGRLLLNSRHALVINITLTILAWSLFVVLFNNSENMYVVGKYTRIFITTAAVLLIVSSYRYTPSEIILYLMVLFLFHYVAILCQFLFPQIQAPMAKLFGFQRSISILNEFSYRKLGMSSSYDTAALISVLGMSMLLVCFSVRRQYRYLLLATIGLAFSMMSSRIGMMLGGSIYISILLVYSVRVRTARAIVPALSLVVIAVVLAKTVIPLIFTSANIHASSISTGLIGYDILSEYTAGTYTALTDTHLDALRLPLDRIILGMGTDPTYYLFGHSDIGYVKMIYHIGIIGMLLVLVFHWVIFYRAYRKNIRADKGGDVSIVAIFIIIYIILLIIMNYKNLEMYSRGNHEMLLFAYASLYNTT